LLSSSQPTIEREPTAETRAGTAGQLAAGLLVIIVGQARQLGLVRCLRCRKRAVFPDCAGIPVETLSGLADAGGYLSEYERMPRVSEEFGSTQPLAGGRSLILEYSDFDIGLQENIPQTAKIVLYSR
jgi:hypothetical protein